MKRTNWWYLLFVAAAVVAEEAFRPKGDRERVRMYALPPTYESMREIMRSNPRGKTFIGETGRLLVKASEVSPTYTFLRMAEVVYVEQ